VGGHPRDPTGPEKVLTWGNRKKKEWKNGSNETRKESKTGRINRSVGQKCWQNPKKTGDFIDQTRGTYWWDPHNEKNAWVSTQPARKDIPEKVPF